MSTNEQEYKEIFLAEANECYEVLNRLFTELESDHQNHKAINSIFRHIHTLKGNAMGLGFSEIAELSHVIEEIFDEVKNGRFRLDEEIFSNLYKAIDKLGQLINAVTTREKVSYKGIRTKLVVALNHIKANRQNTAHTEKEEQPVNLNQTSNANITETLLTEIPEEEITDEETDSSGMSMTLSDVVQVPVRKLDALLNYVGELIIEKDSLTARNVFNNHRGNEFARLHRITSDLQYGIMDIRLIQVGFLFNKFHRVVRDVAKLEGKEVGIVLEGTEIEIDRNILRTITDSLVHLVRNAVGHGLESPEERKKAGKSPKGTIFMRARNEKDHVIIEVTDDGRGIDGEQIKDIAIKKGVITAEQAVFLNNEDALYLIFKPGFSSAETVTSVSGRGVGMDVVKRSVESIGGKVSIETEIGNGTTFSLLLPSSMALKGALLFELEHQEYAIPLSVTEAVISIDKSQIHISNSGLFSQYLGSTITIIFLQDIFKAQHTFIEDYYTDFKRSFEKLKDDSRVDVVIVSYSGIKIGLVVDKLLQQKEIVEKTLSKPVDRIDLISGATILGNGNVCLVLNMSGLLTKSFTEHRTLIKND